MNKEMTRLAKEQEIKKAAELKAKLDMVTMQNKPSYGRAARKIGEMICDTGIKVGYGRATAKFTLRLDSTKGLFIAEHGDVWYVSTSKEALQTKMDQVARVTYDLKWTRYLHVEYTAMAPSRDAWRMGYDTNLDIDDKRDSKRPIFGLKLSWETVEYSTAIALPGDDGERYMKREVDADGAPSEDQESVRTLPAGLVPYTKEREDLLKEFRAALGAIDSKMVKLFSGVPEQVGYQLDGVKGGALLLAAPKKGRSK